MTDSKVRARLDDIKKNPDRHRHSFEGLHACCTVDGVLHMNLMDAHQSISTRTNGGVRCDVYSGPCACGAWH